MGGKDHALWLGDRLTIGAHVLTLVHNGKTNRDGRGLSVAAAHLQSAMLHINTEARAKVPAACDDGTPELEQLRGIVSALNDLLIDISSLNRAS